MKSNVDAILEKSIACAVSAIEIYNKPDFKYREETFSILMIKLKMHIITLELYMLKKTFLKNMVESLKDGNIK